MRHRYFVYEVICPTGFIYVGMTNNLSRRLNQHKSSCHNRLGMEHFKKRKIAYDSCVFRIVARFLTREMAKNIEAVKILEYEKTGKSLNVAGRTNLPARTNFNRVDLSKFV